MENNLFLVLMDINHIKEYIFATNKLQEIRGASTLLESLNLFGTLELLTNTGEFGKGNYAKQGMNFLQLDKNIFDDTLDWEVIYLGGGAGKVLFKNRDMAVKFCEGVESQILNETKSATMTTHIEPWHPNIEKFKHVLDISESHMHAINSFSTKAEYHCGGLYIQPCQLCGSLPASGYHRDRVGNVLVCEACEKKRKKDTKFSQYTIEGRESIESFLRKKAIASGLLKKDDKIKFPQELNEIGAASSPQNYVSLLYADGNNMGKKLKELLTENPDQYELYSKFSLYVDQSSKEAIADAIVDHVWKKENDVLPVSFILGGGDDLIAILPAQSGADVAVKFTQRFTEHFEKRIENDSHWNQKVPMTASAGLVFTKSTYPIKQMVDRADELLKLAKKKFRLEADAISIDFAVIKSASCQPISASRQKDYTKIHGTGMEIRRFARPYRLNEFINLVDHIRAFQKSGFPMSKLHDFYETLFADYWQSILTAAKFVNRLPQTAETTGVSPKEALLNFWEDKNLDLFPWRKAGPSISETPLSDLIELYEFIQ